MRHSAFAKAAMLPLATRLVSAADMFLTITPHPGPLAQVYYATSSTIPPTIMITATTPTQPPEPLPPVTQIQPECTWGLTNQCMPIYTTVPQSADASTLAMAKGIETAHWFIASGGSVLLLCTGKVEAVALLILLAVAKAQGQDVQSHAPGNTVTSTTMTTTTALPSTDMVVWSPATALVPNATVPEYKMYCGMISDELFYPSTCPGGISTMVPSPTVPEDKLYCYATINGLLYPSTCPEGFNPTAPSPPLQPGECERNGLVYRCGNANERSAAHTIFNVDVTVIITLWHFWLPLLAWYFGLISEDVLALVWLCAALNIRVLAEQAVSTVPAVTSTVTIYRATPLDQVEISTTVTALQALTAQEEIDSSSTALEAPAEASSLVSLTLDAVMRAVEADTCPTLYGIPDCPKLYGLQNFPLPHPAPASSGAASLNWPTALATVLAALTLSRVTNCKTVLAVWGFLAVAIPAQAIA
ncbi:hypothetical protein LTR74_009307 [Friedmanniomyces endolithicus]|nr:hypothetical protein LTR74_009307 [Friedmanniomyces endolithicus]